MVSIKISPRAQKNLLEIKEYISEELIYLPTNSFYRVLSAEAYSKHGLRAVCS